MTPCDGYNASTTPTPQRFCMILLCIVPVAWRRVLWILIKLKLVEHDLEPRLTAHSCAQREKQGKPTPNGHKPHNLRGFGLCSVMLSVTQTPLGMTSRGTDPPIGLPFNPAKPPNCNKETCNGCSGATAHNVMKYYGTRFVEAK